MYIAAQSCFGTSYYVDTAGIDTNSGLSLNSALKTIPSAIAKIATGDTIYVRGGRYYYTSKITISKSGTKDILNYLLAYNNEKVILDFSKMALGSSNQGMQLNGSYWYIKGFEIYNAGDNGLLVQGGSYNHIELCSFVENRDAGMEVKGGASYNKFINCDAYNNADPATNYGNADGFAVKIDPGTGNYFYGCRAWNNSDDGWDGYLKTTSATDNITTTLENCWVFKSGYLKDGSLGPGNGNGFKTGGSTNKDQRHNQVLINCLSFGNGQKGFDKNNNVGSVTLINCSSVENGAVNYDWTSGNVLDSGKVLTIKNCLSLHSNSNKNFVALAGIVMDTATNSFHLSNRGVYNTATTNDFIETNIDSAVAQCASPRKADGSLPDITFMHFKPGSKLINVGTIINNIPYKDDTGVPYKSYRPDLGCFESTDTTTPVSYNITTSVTGSGTIILNPVDKEYFDGCIVSATAKPDSGYIFYSWSGDKVDTSKSIKIEMNTNKTLNAIFYKTSTKCTITLDTIGSGTLAISPSDGRIYQGMQISITAKPKYGYTFSSWKGDTISSANPLVFTIDGNKNYIATFSPIVINFINSENEGINDVRIYPTIATDNITLKYSIVENGTIHISLFDLMGKKYLEKTISTATGVKENNVSINISSFTPGIYILKCNNINNSEKPYIFKIIKK